MVEVAVVVVAAVVVVVVGFVVVGVAVVALAVVVVATLVIAERGYDIVPLWNGIEKVVALESDAGDDELKDAERLNSDESGLNAVVIPEFVLKIEKMVVIFAPIR